MKYCLGELSDVLGSCSLASICSGWIRVVRGSQMEMVTDVSLASVDLPSSDCNHCLSQVAFFSLASGPAIIIVPQGPIK